MSGESVSTSLPSIGKHTRQKGGFKKLKSTQLRKCPESLVYVCYRDHVLYHRCDPQAMKPHVRETVGWLVYDCEEYIIVCWDRDAGPPTLNDGDLKASGLVILKSDIVEYKKVK